MLVDNSNSNLSPPPYPSNQHLLRCLTQCLKMSSCLSHRLQFTRLSNKNEGKEAPPPQVAQGLPDQTFLIQVFIFEGTFSAVKVFSLVF